MTNQTMKRKIKELESLSVESIERELDQFFLDDWLNEAQLNYIKYLKRQLKKAKTKNKLIKKLKNKLYFV
jgi:hypothetical protein